MESPNKEAWARLKAERKNLLPTPPVGASVQWFTANSGTTPRAGIVTFIEGPGRVCLQVLAPNAMPITQKGVYFEQHPDAKKAGRNGTYKYLPGREVPVEDYVLHETLLKEREEKLKRMDEEAALAVKRREEELKAATVAA